MRSKLIIAEGLPCSGKSRTARYIAEHVGGRYFDEGCGCHPADHEDAAFVSEAALAEMADTERCEILAAGEKYRGGLVVPLRKFSGELFDKLLRTKIYDVLDWETESTLMLEKWERFAQAAAAGEDVYVFNCVLLQNPMCETMMRFDFPIEKSRAFIGEIAQIIEPLSPAVVYLDNADIAGCIKAALPERGEDWLNAVIGYHCSGGYGRANGLAGFKGYISALEERRRRELAILKGLPVKALTLRDPQADRTVAYRAIDEFLKGI